MAVSILSLATLRQGPLHSQMCHLSVYLHTHLPSPPQLHKMGEVRCGLGYQSVGTRPPPCIERETPSSFMHALSLALPHAV